MDKLYFVLYLLAALCFVLAWFNFSRPRFTMHHLIAAGLLFWVLVPLIQTLKAL